MKITPYCKFKKFLRQVALQLTLAVATVVLLEIILRIVFGLKDMSTGGFVDPRTESDSYKDSSWAITHFRELTQAREAWEPYVYWRHLPFSGQYLNILPNGNRRTSNPTGTTSDAIRIGFLGGSTMWGEGVRDNATIPSMVSKYLNERGIPATVENLAESGYVSTQELIDLMLRIRRGESPDVVVFYDGVNDVFAAYQSGEAGLPQNEQNRRI